MNTTLPLAVSGTDAERRSAFMDALSDKSVGNALDNRLGVYSRLLGLRPKSGQPLNLLKTIQRGLPLSAGEKLAEHIGMDSKTFFLTYVGMSDSTLRRRLKDLKPLSVDESDRVVRYAHLLHLATRLMDSNEDDAREWLSSPAHALGDASPLETAVTEAGARRVEHLIVALEHGMFS